MSDLVAWAEASKGNRLRLDAAALLGDWGALEALMLMGEDAPAPHLEPVLCPRGLDQLARPERLALFRYLLPVMLTPYTDARANITPSLRAVAMGLEPSSELGLAGRWWRFIQGGPSKLGGGIFEFCVWGDLTHRDAIGALLRPVRGAAW